LAGIEPRYEGRAVCDPVAEVTLKLACNPKAAITALAVFSCAAEARKVPRKIACVD
jgi:hypothetical protein